MKKYLSLFLYFAIITFSCILIYSCGCSCYEEENFIKVDTVHKHVNISETGPFYVQIGAFVNKANAENFAAVAKSKLNKPVISKSFSDGIYRILIGEFTEFTKADEMLSYVKSYGYSDAIIRDLTGPVIKNN